MAQYSIQTPYNRIAKEKQLTSGELNALRHFWLVQQVGRTLADLREGNTRGKNIPFIGGLLASDNDPIDYWNNAVADTFLDQGLIPSFALDKAAENIKNRKYMRNPQYPWIVNEN
jgi:hypothetical protein